MATFATAGRTYAAVTSYNEHGIQIINLTDPANPSPVANLTDTTLTALDSANNMATFTTAGRTYAVVIADRDDGIQIINLTDPANPSPVASLTATDLAVLADAVDVTTFTTAGRTYAVVTTSDDDAVQIIDLTDPASPSPIASLTDTALTALDSARDVAIFTTAGRTYAVVAAYDDDGIQIIDLTDPAGPSPIASLTDTTLTALDGATGVATFTTAGRTYAAVTAYDDVGIQIIDLTYPANPSPVANLTDTTLTALDGASDPAIFTAAGRTYAVVAAYDESGVQILQLLTEADIPPIITSAAYNTGTGILDITFSKPLDPTITYSGINLAGENGNVTLDAVTTKSHSTNTITATLDAAQRTTVGDAITLTVSAGAVSDTAGNGIAQVTVSVTVTDGILPTLASSLYNTGSGILDITFSEPLNGTAIHYDRLHIRDIGQSIGGISLDTVATRVLDPSSTTITITLSAVQRQVVNAMVTPQLDIEAGAVSDIAGNGIAAAPDQPVTVTDVTPPTVSLSSYNIDTGILSITFNEPLDHAVTDYSGLIISGQQGNVTLDQVATKTADVNTIWATLDTAQMETAGTAPALIISEGAVADIAGNRIAGTTVTIKVTMLGSPIVEIKPVATLGSSDETIKLGNPAGLALFEISGKTYAIVSSVRDDAIQIIDLTNPASPTPVASLTNTAPAKLNGAIGVDIFTAAGRTYAAVAANGDDALQIVDLTDPARPAAAGNLTDTALTELDGAIGVATFTIAGRTHAVVTANADGAIQIVDLTNPARPAPVASLTDTALTELDGAIGVDTFTTAGRTYAVVTANNDNGIQIINLTDPARPAPVASLTDTALTELRGALGVATFTIAGHTYAVVTAHDDNGIQIVDLANPASPSPIASLTDTALTELDGAIGVDTFTTADRTYAVVAANDDDGIQIIDLTNPARPFPAAGLTNTALTELDGAWDVEVFTIAGRTYAAVTAYGDSGIQIVQLLTEIEASPKFASAAYNTGTGILNITFSEPLNGTAIHYDRLHIRDMPASPSGGLSLGDVATRAVGPSSTTMTITLSAVQRQTVNDMVTPQLDIEAGAVSDTTGNKIAAAPDRPITVTDVTPPTLASSSYNTGTGILNITFSEPLGTGITYSGIKLAGENGNVTLDAVTPKRHSARTIIATLDAAQRTTVGDAITLTVSAGAVADTAGNGIAQATVTVDVTDGILPALSSSSYNMDTGIFNMTFSEPLNGTAIHYDRLHIRDTGQLIGGISLGDVATRAVDPSSTTITLTLSAVQRQMVNGMAAPQLDIEAGAVSDTTGNEIAAAPDRPVTIIDGIPPTVTSSSYTDTGILIIAFSESLNHAATDYSGLIISGQQGNVTLDQVATKTAVGSAIWATLDAAQMETAGTAPALVISEGAVRDPAGNRIAETTETIEVTMLGSPIAEIKPVATLDDSDENTKLGNPAGLALFEIGGNTYAIVSSVRDNAIQIINLTNPASPAPVASLADTAPAKLGGAIGVDTFTIAGRTYAAVAADADDAIQIIDLTNPARPAAAGNLTDTAPARLDGATGVDTFTIAGRTYAAVAANEDDAIQIINLTNPARPAPVASLTDTTLTEFGGPVGVDTFTITGRTYAAVAADTDDAIQIIDITNPARPAPITSLANTALTKLGGATGVDTFTITGRTYAVVTAHDDNAIQIVDLANPARPAPIASLTDTALTELHGATGVDTFTTANRTYAAVAATTDDGIQIIDLTNPARPAPVANLTDTALTELDGALDVEIFTIANSTYAAVTAFGDAGIQVVQLLTEGGVRQSPLYSLSAVSATYHAADGDIGARLVVILSGPRQRHRPPGTAGRPGRGGSGCPQQTPDATARGRPRRPGHAAPVPAGGCPGGRHPGGLRARPGRGPGRHV